MTQPLFPTPPAYTLPLVKGQDLIVTFKRTVGGEPEPYEDGTTVTLIIDTGDTPTEAVAAITGADAVARIESEEADLIPTGRLWRCRVSVPGDVESDDVVAVHGKTGRFDGKSA